MAKMKKGEVKFRKRPLPKNAKSGTDKRYCVESLLLYLCHVATVEEWLVLQYLELHPSSQLGFGHHEQSAIAHTSRSSHLEHRRSFKYCMLMISMFDLKVGVQI